MLVSTHVIHIMGKQTNGSDDLKTEDSVSQGHWHILPTIPFYNLLIAVPAGFSSHFIST